MLVYQYRSAYAIMRPLAMERGWGGDLIQVSFPPSLFHPPKLLRYGYDALVE